MDCSLAVLEFTRIVKVTSSCNGASKRIQDLRSAASDLGLHCLPMAHKKDAMLTWVKMFSPTRQLL